MPGLFSRLAAFGRSAAREHPLNPAIRELRFLPNRLAGGAIGTGVGYGAGRLQNEYIYDQADQAAKDRVTYANMILGALLGGTRMGRKTYLERYERPLMTPHPEQRAGEASFAISNKFKPMKSLFTIPGAFGLTGLTAAEAPQLANMYRSAKGAIDSPKTDEYLADVATKGPVEATVPRVTKSVMADKDIRKTIGDLVEIVGSMTGGSILGYLGGGSLGGLIGNQLSPDDPDLDYENRLKREKRREELSTIGKLIGSTAGGVGLSVGIPALKMRLGLLQ